MTAITAKTAAAPQVVDRAALRAELKATRTSFRALVESLADERWRQPCPGSAWTVGEVMVHLTWALEQLPAEVASARRGRGMFNYDVRSQIGGADRRRLCNAIESISLGREDLTGLLPGIGVPTLFVTAAEVAESSGCASSGPLRCFPGPAAPTRAGRRPGRARRGASRGAGLRVGSISETYPEIGDSAVAGVYTSVSGRS